MKRRIIWCLAALCLGALLSWRWLAWEVVKAETRRRFPTVPRMQPRELAAWLDNARRPPPVLLDVREPAEFAVSHLACARQVDPGSDPAQLDLTKDQPIVAYCSVGYRSADFSQRLQQAGFTHISNLEGSIFQWANEGRALVRHDGERAAQVHPYNQTWGLLLKPALRANVPPAGDNGH